MKINHCSPQLEKAHAPCTATKTQCNFLKKRRYPKTTAVQKKLEGHCACPGENTEVVSEDGEDLDKHIPWS